MPLCESCDMSGKEKRLGSGLTLDECKLKCIDDDACLGIDFGKAARTGKCYGNYDQNDDYKDNANYDAWYKNPDCGTLCWNNYI